MKMISVYSNKAEVGKRLVLCLLLVTSLLAMACGPQISKQVRYEWQDYNAAESKQTSEGITVENKPVKEFPPTFYVTVQDCDKNTGSPYVDDYKKPVMAKVPVTAPGQFWFQVAVTNNTDHVVRLNSVVIRFFDPASNQFEPLSKDDIAADYSSTRGACLVQASQGTSQIKSIKLVDRNAELLPNTTITGWLAFKPDKLDIPGVWKLSIYEVPVATDEAGKVTKTTKFEIRQVVKKFVDTYRSENAFSPSKLVETQEVTD